MAIDPIELKASIMAELGIEEMNVETEAAAIKAASAAVSPTGKEPGVYADELWTALITAKSTHWTANEDMWLAISTGIANYFDSVVGELQIDWKGSVKACTTLPIVKTGTMTLDGVPLVAGDRVLVTGQSSSKENGIYVVSASAWSRAEDADESADVSSGMTVYVERGTVNGRYFWVLTTNNPIVLGTTGLTFAKYGSGGAVPGKTSDYGFVWDVFECNDPDKREYTISHVALDNSEHVFLNGQALENGYSYTLDDDILTISVDVPLGLDVDNPDRLTVSYQYLLPEPVEEPEE